MDKISVIVPVYNVENYLQQCINSILQQTYHHLEIILIDDGSKDSSGKICDEYALKDDRIVVIHKENGGVSSARNKGIEVATGKYIAFVDADDWIEPEMYEVMLQKLLDSNVDIVRCLQKTIYHNYVANDDLYEEGIIDLSQSRNEIIENIFVNGKTPSFFLMLMKKEILDSYQIMFDEDLILGEDLYFMLNIYLHANTLYLYNKYLYNYLIHENSAMNSKEKNKRMALNLRELFKKIKQLLIENNLYYQQIKSGVGNYFFYRLYMRCAKQVAMEKDKTFIDTLFKNEEAIEIINNVNRKKLSFFGKTFYNFIKRNKKNMFYYLCRIYGKLKLLS